MPIITLRVPVEVLPAARMAAKAFDPDVAGELSFGQTDENGLHFCTVDVSDEYAAAFPAFKAFPELLRDTIALDFANRFPDAPVPSIEDVTAFCEAVVIEMPSTIEEQ